MGCTSQSIKPNACLGQIFAGGASPARCLARPTSAQGGGLLRRSMRELAGHMVPPDMVPPDRAPGDRAAAPGRALRSPYRSRHWRSSGVNECSFCGRHSCVQSQRRASALVLSCHAHEATTLPDMYLVLHGSAVCAAEALVLCCTCSLKPYSGLAYAEAVAVPTLWML